MLMVSVNVGKDKQGKMRPPIVGLLIDTHLLPTQGPPKATIGEGGQLVQTQGASGLQAMGVVAAGTGFIVGPLASMTPIMQPDEDDVDAEIALLAPDEEVEEVEDGERKEELSA